MAPPTSNGSPKGQESLLSVQDDTSKQYAGSRMITLPLTYHTYTVQYLKNRLIATAIRLPLFFLISLSYYVVHSALILRVRYGVTRRRLNIPSRGKRRSIRADIYTPVNQHSTAGKPVHINWHGSGFVLDCFGADGELCAYLANKLQCTVIDSDYRKAPEYPFPAGIQDAEDVVKYVFANPNDFDTDNVTVGGSSAGANLALVMGVLFGNRLRGVASIAPPTDFRPSSRPKVALERNHPRALPPRVSLFFDSCYLIPKVDRDDPRLSPSCADLAKQGQLGCDSVLIVTGTGDTLYNDGKQLIENLQRQGHKRATFLPVKGEGHGFEKAFRGERRQTALKIFDTIASELKQSWKASEQRNGQLRASL